MQRLKMQKSGTIKPIEPSPYKLYIHVPAGLCKPLLVRALQKVDQNDNITLSGLVIMHAFKLPDTLGRRIYWVI